MVKLLLFRGSPRSNIHEVERWNKHLEDYCDVLCVRYAMEFEAYEYARGYFLNHPEYDYLVIATDDIVVTVKDIKQLKDDLEAVDYPVLSGLMNVDEKDHDDMWGNLNITYELAAKDRRLRFYNFVKFNELPVEDIFQVMFAGFGLTAIRRDIIEEPGFNFASDGIFRGTGIVNGASLDLVFCWWCMEHKDEKGNPNPIPIFCDQRIHMHHLRDHGRSQVGEREKVVEINGKEYPFGYV